MPRRRQHASVILMVLVTIAFASAALLAFIERASDDLIEPSRAINANRLRAEARSAMETVLAVLVDWRAANGNNLRSPAEGWDGEDYAHGLLDYEWVGYIPLSDRHTVTVTFEDESAKLSLPLITDQNLLDFFTYYPGLSLEEATYLRDTLLTWMKPNYTPTASGAYTAAQYQDDPIPFTPPRRSLRSWDELASIEGLRDPSTESTGETSAYFYDSAGRLTPLGKRFIHAFSLYSFTAPNVNGALRHPDTLAVLGKLGVDEQQRVQDFLAGEGSGSSIVKGTGFFTAIGDVASIAQILSAPAGMGVNTTALRVNVTVKEGLAVFTLSALVTWPNGATAVAAPAPPSQSTTANSTTQVTTAPLTTVQLNYPYTILELKESDLDPADPASQPAGDAELTQPFLIPPST